MRHSPLSQEFNDPNLLSLSTELESGSYTSLRFFHYSLLTKPDSPVLSSLLTGKVGRHVPCYLLSGSGVSKSKIVLQSIPHYLELSLVSITRGNYIVPLTLTANLHQNLNINSRNDTLTYLSVLAIIS
ncbi:hypothetical protein Tco_0896012 [Tanacetum coccineum]